MSSSCYNGGRGYDQCVLRPIIVHTFHLYTLTVYRAIRFAYSIQQILSPGNITVSVRMTYLSINLQTGLRS